MRRIILDTDPGVDDAKAICLLLAQLDTVKVEGITIVFGNHYKLDQLALNAKHIVELVAESKKLKGKSHRIPIYKGAHKPLDTDYHGHSGIQVHGEDSLGLKGASYFADSVHSKMDHSAIDAPIIEKEHASSFIKNQVDLFPGEIEIIALGPLTNIALALSLGLDASKVKAVYHMGGAFNERGNKTPVAEANIHNDPVAAKLVYDASFPRLVLSPLNMTRQLCLRTSIKTLTSSHASTPRSIPQFISDISLYYIELLESWGTTQVAIHDSCAVLTCTHPHLFTFLETHVDVETSNGLARGLTIADLKGHYKKLKTDYRINASIAMHVDTKAFYSTVQSLLQSFHA
mmetsp:Transcript_6104/g.8891  ORF Transcript_6104/g.8891 Transcript_6104/m.8891 type:complete len:345 (-) Transcript_6104:43-1077(-)